MRTYSMTGGAEEPFFHGGGKVEMQAWSNDWNGQTLTVEVSTSGKAGTFTALGGETSKTEDGFARFSAPEGSYVRPVLSGSAAVTVSFSS